MRRWAWMVAALYGAVLLVLTGPMCLLAFAPGIKFSGSWGVLGSPLDWIWLAVMVASQMALLGVPVRVASRRPLTRGPIWRTVLAGGLMAGGLAAGAFLSIYEFIMRDKDNGNWCIGTAVALGALTWCIWSLIFLRLSRRVDAPNLVSRQCRSLFKGSVLELLIAVPTHVVARHRDYCCAGYLTFIGLTMGVSVMLFAFGPAVFFLFVERWKRLHPGETPA